MFCCMYHVVNTLVFCIYQQPTIIYVMFTDIQILMLIITASSVMKIKFPVMHTTFFWCIIVINGPSFFLCSCTHYVLHACLCFVLLLYLACVRLVFTCWLTDTSYTYTNKNSNPLSASSISLWLAVCVWWNN